jgi:hypothetical protein
MRRPAREVAMFLLSFFRSAPAALGLAIGLSGCVIETGDDWEAKHDCRVDGRTSGAYDGRVTAIDGCSFRVTVIGYPDAATHMERRIGVFLKDGFAFGHLDVSLFGELEEEGDAIAAVITATTSDGVSWVTPDGACTADYVSTACVDETDSPGRRYTVEGVECNQPATAEGKQDLVIEELRITSGCQAESSW